jgi:hypothetical protein
MHATSHSDIPDMIHLGDLTEGAICRNILLRYNKDKIYVSLSCFENQIMKFSSRHISDQF